MKVAVLTPYSSLADEGGKCVQGAGAGNECYDHFAVPLFRVSSTWTRYSLTWQQLGQAGWGQKIPTSVQPEKEIIGMSFSPVWTNDAAPNKSFDFALDDISFDVGGTFADTGFQSFVSKSMFDGAYASRRAGAAAHPIYANAYQDIIEVLNDPRFSRLFREGSIDDRKRELAGFLAHLVQESGSLRYAEEINKEVYCRPASQPVPVRRGQVLLRSGTHAADRQRQLRPVRRVPRHARQRLPEQPRTRGGRRQAGLAGGVLLLDGLEGHRGSTSCRARPTPRS